MPLFRLCERQNSVPRKDFWPQMMQRPCLILRIWYFRWREISRYARSSSTRLVLLVPTFIRHSFQVKLRSLPSITTNKTRKSSPPGFISNQFFLICPHCGVNPAKCSACQFFYLFLQYLDR